MRLERAAEARQLIQQRSGDAKKVFQRNSSQVPNTNILATGKALNCVDILTLCYRSRTFLYAVLRIRYVYPGFRIFIKEF